MIDPRYLDPSEAVVITELQCNDTSRYNVDMVCRVGNKPKYQGRSPARLGPVNAFQTPTNREKMNLIRTLFVLHLSKHKPGPVPTLYVGMYYVAK